MRKTLVVAMREYQAAVKTKAFIITLILMPVFYGGMIGVQLLLRDKVDTADKRIAVWDRSGQLYDSIVEAAEKRNATEIFRGDAAEGRQIGPRFLVERVEDPTQAPEKMALGLSERVRKKELFAFIIIDPSAVDGGTAEHGPVQYHSNSPTYDDLPEWLAGPINQRIQAIRLERANMDVETVRRATQRVPVSNLGLFSLDEAGNIKQAEETNRVANFLVPMGLMMLMVMVVMIGASPLMQSVLEEKMQRIAEVLLGSVTPFQLMFGKLLGMTGVSLTIATVYLIGAFYALLRAGYGGFFPAEVVWWFALYLILAVFMYGAMFIAVGAAVTDMKEAQSILTPVMLLIFSPLFIWPNVIKEPHATFSVVASLFPPATPMLMLIRQAVPPGVPLWQPLLGFVLVTLMTLATVFAAGRIFRIGILMQGRGAKVGEMMRWIIRG